MSGGGVGLGGGWPIFKIFANFFFYMGPQFVDFTFAFDSTLIRLEMTKIWPEKCSTGVFAPHLESSAQNPPWDRVKLEFNSKGQDL